MQIKRPNFHSTSARASGPGPIIPGRPLVSNPGGRFLAHHREAEAPGRDELGLWPLYPEAAMGFAH